MNPKKKKKRMGVGLETERGQGETDCLFFIFYIGK